MRPRLASSILRSLLACLMLVLGVHTARAEPDKDEVSRARAHFEVGSGLYQLGRYDDAVREFSAGYALTKRPLFLLNIGQCYLLLRRYDLAHDAIRRYLDEESPRAAERASAGDLLKKIDALAAAAPIDEPRPVATPPVVAPQPVVVTPVAPSPALSLDVTPPPDRSARRRKLAIGLGVGAAVLVTAGVIIALVVTFPTQTQPSSGLGTFHFGH